MPRLIWTPNALAGVQRLYRWLLPKDADAAKRAAAMIREEVKVLAQLPRVGRPAEDMNLLMENTEIYDDVAAILDSGMFDVSWYIKKYPDVASLGVGAVEHYLFYGGRMRRSPSAQFDAAAYLEANPDVAEDGMNPLLHYIKWGKSEGRVTFPVLDPISLDSWRATRSTNKPVILYETHNFTLSRSAKQSAGISGRHWSERPV